MSELKINKNWVEPIDDLIDVPDVLMPLFNKVGMQIKFHTISGENEILSTLGKFSLK